MPDEKEREPAGILIGLAAAGAVGYLMYTLLKDPEGATVACPDCGHKVISGVDECPHCGTELIWT
jgi:DNA-directed RNA polymerase subunit RPC12/RpoP